jgi:hypothetical protein
MCICAVTTRFDMEFFLNQKYKPDFVRPDFNGYIDLFGLAE